MTRTRVKNLSYTKDADQQKSKVRNAIEGVGESAYWPIRTSERKDPVRSRDSLKTRIPSF